MADKSASGEELHALFKEVIHLQAQITAIMDIVHEQAGMHTPQIRLGTLLLTLGQMTVPDAAYAMNVSRQFIQATANKMEKMGLVVFKDNPRHKRSRLLALSELGQQKLEQTRKREAAIVKKGFPEIDSNQVANAADLLRSLNRRFQGFDTEEIKNS